jgi:hypothetical protein
VAGTLVAGLVGVSVTAAHGPDPVLSGEALYPQNQPLSFRWGSPAPPSTLQVAIRAGGDDANASRGAKGPIFSYDPGGTSFVQYGGQVVCGVNGIACMRRDEPTSFRMYFREQGRVFDWGTLKWCQAYSTWPNGCYDVENIALDEFGHVHILGHHVNYSDGRDYTDSVVQEFSRTKPTAGWNAHAFARCDVATLQREYGLLAASTAVSTCIDVATTLNLTPNTTSVAAGDIVVFTASLRITDLDAYERLGGQGLSSRSIQLERRWPGGTWTALKTMTAGSSPGAYSASISVLQTADYRAVFAKPSNEGVRAATSTTVTVTASSCGNVCPNAAVRRTTTR